MKYKTLYDVLLAKPSQPEVTNPPEMDIKKAEEVKTSKTSKEELARRERLKKILQELQGNAP